MKISVLSTLSFLALASAQGDTCDGINLWTMSEVSAHSTSTACLMVIYDVVYDLKAFADVHRGGKWSITRNCGTDTTFGYESLACIPGVPDHTRGVLNMVSDVVVGVIKDSPEDPCGAQGSNYPPEYVSPDFESCKVYDVVTCDSLDAMPNGGKWTMDQVSASSTGCIVKLFDYVYDVGSPPQTSNPFTHPNSGSLTFAEKHGGGSDAVLRQCRTDMTEIFKRLVNKREIPDHTKGALNAILPYLVGVIEDSPSDPCSNPPPAVCIPSKISYKSMSEVASAPTGCIVVILGKVYNLADFAQHHYGGRDEIEESCGDDITDDFLEKSFHSLAQLGAIQQFQVGVVPNSMADPCSSNYVANSDPIFGDDWSSGGDDGGGDDSSGESDGNDGETTRAPVFEPAPSPTHMPTRMPVFKPAPSPTHVPTRAPVSEPTSNSTHVLTSNNKSGDDDKDNNNSGFFNYLYSYGSFTLLTASTVGDTLPGNVLLSTFCCCAPGDNSWLKCSLTVNTTLLLSR